MAAAFAIFPALFSTYLRICDDLLAEADEAVDLDAVLLSELRRSVCLRAASCSAAPTSSALNDLSGLTCWLCLGWE